MAAKRKDILSINIYELLEVSPDAAEKDIRRAYRKKALKVHPDKNKNDPKANALFHELSEALEVLVDKSARSAYDKLLKAREQAKLKDLQLNAKRRKLKSDLESREKAAAESSQSKQTFDVDQSAKVFEAEIERLRREGSRVLEEEQERLKQKLVEDLLSASSQDQEDESSKQLWVTWKVEAGARAYTEEEIRRIFFKYGDCHVVFSKKKPGKALVDFDSSSAAAQAVQLERGRSDGPLKVAYTDGSTTPKIRATRAPSPQLADFQDFEELVLRQMKEAAEKRRLDGETANEQP